MAYGSEARNGALAGIAVLELTVARAGPTAARQLADWGANVIKIETPEALEQANSFSSGRLRLGSDFQNLHRNRQSITLNLKDPDGIEVLKKLAEQADVLIENFRPDVKNRLGFDYESIAARNNRIVYASISGFGQDGPYVSARCLRPASASCPIQMSRTPSSFWRAAPERGEDTEEVLAAFSFARETIEALKRSKAI